MGDKKDLAELFNNEEGGLQLDGEDISLDDVKRFRDTRKNLESDYTKDKQKLQKEREKFNEATKEVAEMQAYFTENPEQAKILTAMLEGKEVVLKTDKPSLDGTPSADGQKKELTEALKKIENLEKQFLNKDEREKLEADTKQEQDYVQKSITEQRKKYPELSEQLVLAQLMSIPNIDQLDDEKFDSTVETLCEQSHKSCITQRDQNIKDYLDGKFENTTTSEGGGGTPGSKPKPMDRHDLKSGKVRQQVLKDLTQRHRASQ